MFFGHTVSFWALVATVAYDVLTAAVVVVALRSYRTLRLQVDHERAASESALAASNEHHSDQMTILRGQLEQATKFADASFRPFLVVEKAVLRPIEIGSAARVIEVQVHNVGTGPAIEIVAHVWAYRIPPGTQPTTTQLWDQAVAAADRELAQEGPLATGKTVAVAKDATRAIVGVTAANSLVIETLEGCELAFVYVTLECEDAYGQRRRFPPPGAPGKVRHIRRQAMFEDHPAVLE